MKYFKFIVLLLFVALGFGCKKDGGSTPATPSAPSSSTTTKDIYIAGYEWVGNKEVATLWINGVATHLATTDHNSRAYDVIVKNGTVYVVGYELNGSNVPVAKIWTNGVATSLTDGTQSGSARKIGIAGDDIYVLGTSSSTPLLLWKNNILVNNPAPAGFGANSLVTNGLDYYLIGMSNTKAAICKNGVVTTLSNLGSNLFDLAIMGTNLYAVGYQMFTPTLGITNAAMWKNSQITKFYSGIAKSQLNVVALSGNDVYIAGYVDSGYATNQTILLKNGVKVDLPIISGFLDPKKMAVVDGKVHIAGTLTNTSSDFLAVDWVDGEINYLSDSYSEAFGLFIYEHS